MNNFNQNSNVVISISISIKLKQTNLDKNETEKITLNKYWNRLKKIALDSESY